MLKREYSRIIEDIRYCRIYSSTESVLAGLDLLRDIVESAGSAEGLARALLEITPLLLSARPASAMLWNYTRKVISEVIECLRQELALDSIKSRVVAKIGELGREIGELRDAVARIASHRIEEGDVILTSSYSTSVLRALEYGLEEGKNFEVYVAESRPGSEGLELAARLEEMGIETTLFVDSAVRYLMKDVDKVFLSCEAVAANGAVVNKVGSSLIALAASEARVRVLVLAPTAKFCPETLMGELVALAEGEEGAILPPELAREGVRARVPLFDVTPPEYVDAIVTERGLVAPQAVIVILREIYGWPLKFATIEEIVEGLEDWLAAK